MPHLKDSLLEDSEICTEFKINIFRPFGAVYFCALMILSYIGHVVFKSAFVPTFEVLLEGSIDLVVGIVDPDSEYVNLQATLENDYNHTNIDKWWQKLTGADGNDILD